MTRRQATIIIVLLAGILATLAGPFVVRTGRSIVGGIEDAFATPTPIMRVCWPVGQVLPTPDFYGNVFLPRQPIPVGESCPDGTTDLTP